MRPSPCFRLHALLPALALACGAAWAAEALAPEDLRALLPTDFRAIDQPSDDGSVIGIQWDRAPKAGPGVFYIVEIASEADAAAGRFQQAAKVPAGSPKLLRSAYPKYFGFGKANARLCYVPVEPLSVYAPKPPVPPMVTALPPEEAMDFDAAQFAELFLAIEPRLYVLHPDERPPAFRRRVLERFAPAGAQALSDADLSARDAAGFAQALGPPSRGARKYLSRQLTRVQQHVRKEVEAERKAVVRRPYSFRLGVTDGQQTFYVESQGRPTVVVGQARPNLFMWYKLNNLSFSLVFCAVVMAFVRLARRRPNLFIRKIAGLEAVEEAIGRATEMGRSVFFVHGLAGMGSLSTIASVNILGRVARRAAEYETPVRVMNNNPIVMAVSQEVVKQGYTEAGHPDAYNPDDVALVAYDQFSYVAAVGGRMIRERPAAIFLMGYFYAESLLLAETGASTGAIQIAGTDSYTQIPFFITTCDYTLIGEELYAASAYLSREPKLLGSLRGQDVGKAFLMGIFTLGALLSTFGLSWIHDLFRAF